MIKTCIRQPVKVNVVTRDEKSLDVRTVSAKCRFWEGTLAHARLFMRFLLRDEFDKKSSKRVSSLGERAIF